MIERVGQSLRLRMTALVLLALLALIAIGVVAETIREREVEAVMAETLQRDAGLLWRATLNKEFTRLAQQSRRMMADPAVIRAMADPSLAALPAALAPLLPAGRVEVLEAGGGLRFHSGEELAWRPTLAAEALARLQAGETVDRLEIDWGRAVVLVHGEPLPGPERRFWVVSTRIEAALAEMKAGTGSEAFLVNRRGRVLAATDPALWPALAPREAGVVAPPLREYDLEGRSVAVLSVPLDGADGLSGRLVLVRDVSLQAGERRMLQSLSLALAVLATGLVVVGLWLWLRRMFRPLEETVAAIRALSAGDTSVVVSGLERQDEIGRMAQALERFRTHMGALARLQAAEQRQLRRQESFIHREMSALAGTLEPLAREEILRDLAELEGGGSRSAGLGVMAEAFRKMSLRVRQQQQHLQSLIGDLREALKMQTAYLQLQQELDIARQIQKSMLPVNFPHNHPRLDLHAAMEPAKEVGGDFYDFFFLDEQRLGVVVADVSGKGVPAALFMAISRTLLKATALFGSPPARCLANLNNLLAENNEKELFVTLFYGILDLDTGVFTYCNAGHNPPYRIQLDGTVRTLARTGGAPLAIMADLPQRDATIHLAPGEAVFLFTDGVTEAQNEFGDFWGEARFEQGLALSADRSAEAMIEGVYREVRQFVGQAPQCDDITCLAFRWGGRRG